ncbi:hypothetical protein AWC01_18340 [Mycobacterium doricum]|uniref:Uncharacterized protein n=1 Tax=Mycolicibacterium doricum TaxID=126673 RepID=A0A1X1SX70_9MYCO|nr:hypothetical protein AWC01_18340 [Mycolicibacterium doricum]
MAARRQSQPSDGSVLVAIFVLLFVIGLVIKYIRWFVGAAALVGLFFVGRAVARKVEERRELEAESAAERPVRANGCTRLAATQAGANNAPGPVAKRCAPPVGHRCTPALRRAGPREPTP